MKRFVVVPGLNYYFFKEISSPDIYVEEELFLNNTSKVSAFIQRISKKMGASYLYYLFILKWKNKLAECDTCVIFDQAFSTALVKSIKKINPSIRIVVYLWNPSFKNISIINELQKVKELIEIFSFDKHDCEQYEYKFSPMIYNFDIKSIKTEINYDVVFVGYLKNRAKLLSDIYNKLINCGKKCFFYSINNLNVKDDIPFGVYTEYLPYDKYKEKMTASRAVLDIVQEGQIGLTIRTMETICYEKKLITNNKDIINYSFYNKNNIFVIGRDHMEDLDKFISTPFVPMKKEIIAEYNFVDWVKSL